MQSENNFPSLSKSKISKNDTLIPKPIMKYSDVLKQKKTNVNNALKINDISNNEIKNENKTDLLINTISEKTKKLSIENNKSPIKHNLVKPKPQDNINNKEDKNKEEIQEKYQNHIDSIIKIQAWWRMISIVRSMKKINKEKEDNKKKEDNKENEKKENIKKEPVIKKTLPKKPSFSDIVKLTPPSSPSPQTTTTSEKVNIDKSTINSKKSNKKNNNNKNNEDENNNNVNSEKKLKENERKKQTKSKKVNEELNSIFKNMKFMGLIEKEIDDLTEKNTIVNGKQFAKTKVITVKKYSRNNSSSTFSIDDINDNAKETKKKGGKNENKTSDKKSFSKKKNVCFNEKDEVFNEYNHVMKKLDLHIRCDKKSCLIDCYRRLYKREWEDDEETSEESSGSSSNSESEESTENITTTLKKKSDYLYNDIYNPNYSKYYSGSDFDFGNRYFTGKERLKKALHLEPVEVTVQKIIYQPMKYKQNKRYQQKKKNSNKRKQKAN